MLRFLVSLMQFPHLTNKGGKDRAECIFLWRVKSSWLRCFIQMFFQSSPVIQSCPNLSVQFSSVQLLIMSNPMNCSTPGLPVHHQLPEFTETYVHRVGDAIQPSHPLSSPSPPVFNLSQHQGLFQWVSSSYQVANILELQLQHQSFHWILRTDFL